MKLRTLILGSLLFCLLWFMGWEAWAVFDARQRTQQLFAPFGAEEQLDLTWNDLSHEKQNILIQVEDPAFFSHRGVDMRTPGAGGATITQALAKRLYFEKFTPGFAKIEQSLIALLVIDPVVAKEVQLNAFLSVAYFGDDVEGFSDAARSYFGKSIQNLDRPEFIRLVGALVGPNHYKPGTPANEARAVRIARFLRGECAPSSIRDVLYETCENP